MIAHLNGSEYSFKQLHSVHAGQLFVPEFCCRLFVVSFECEGQQWLMLKTALSRVESCGSLPMQLAHAPLPLCLFWWSKGNLACVGTRYFTLLYVLVVKR